MGSTRLPGKVMMDICGKPLIHHALSRINAATNIDKTIVATTTNTEDDELANYLSRHNVTVFRGDSADVLQRFFDCSQQHIQDHDNAVIMRFTCDNPLVDPSIIDDAIAHFCHRKPDYLRFGKGLPVGMLLELFTCRALEVAHRDALHPACREHVTPYFYWNPDIFHCEEFAMDQDNSNLRWTVDTQHDLDLVRAIYSTLCADNQNANPLFNYADILAAYESHPEWLSINADVQQVVVVKPKE